VTPTVGIQLRLPAEIHGALERMAPARGKNKFITELIRTEAIRLGQLPADPAAKPRKRRSTR